MAEFTTENGAEIVIRIAPFEDAMALKSAVSKELSMNGIDIDSMKLNLNSDVSEILPAIVKAVLSLDCSPDVNSAVFKCLERCTYNGERIRKDTFEPEEARENYYQIVFECLKVNLSPFFKRLLSVLSKNGLSVDQILK